MKYQITLNTGAKILCDSYIMLKNNTVSYKTGTIEVLMKEDMYDKDSIEFVRVKGLKKNK